MKSFHKCLGDEGEKLAEQRLKKDGLLFVARNVRTLRGEIDLIFLDGDDLAFVEVKTMSAATEAVYGAPGAKVDREKQRRITLAAAHYLNCHRAKFCRYYPRFDVVEVTFFSDRAEVVHTKNAFEENTGFYKKKLF